MVCLAFATRAAAQELTVTDLTSNATDGVVITFSQDVKVKHSLFGTKCYSDFTDKDGTPSTLNGTPRVEGNVVTLVASYCTFVNGHRIHLALNPECFTSLDGTTTLTGTTSFDFVMGEGQDADPITALLVAPSNGTLTQLRNIAVVFSPTITSIVDKSKFSVVNENGHSLPILSVNIDSETSILALNINIDPENAYFEGGTTYSLHIAPGALKCGTTINEKELVYGKWYIKPEPLTLVTNPPTHRMVEDVQSIVVKAENGERFQCTNPLCRDITVTGTMDEQSIIFARVTEIRPDLANNAFILRLDKAITPALISKEGAASNSVKLNIPEGLFKQGTAINDATQVLWIVQHEAELGSVKWTFDPKQNSDLSQLGNPMDTQNENGETETIYTLNISISGQNAYLVINDVPSIKIVDEDTGVTVMTFGKHDIVTQGVNSYSLRMSQALEGPGAYTLIIPSHCVSYHTDANHYSEPHHSLSDIEATWFVNYSRPTGCDSLQGISNDEIYDLQGRRLHGHAQQGVVISNGRKVVK